MKTLITLALLLLAPLAAHAQAINIGAVHEGTNLATLTTGAEHGILVGVGYGRVVAVADRPVVLAADLTLQSTAADVDDFRVRIGAIAPIIDGPHWKLLGTATPIVRGTRNDISRMINVGADLGVLAGRYSPRWYIAAELGFDWAAATHIAQSDLYRMQVYADARDGWYASTGGVFRAGLQGGVSFGGNDVILRAGKLVDIAGDSPMFPIYATLAYDRRW